MEEYVEFESAYIQKCIEDISVIKNIMVRAMLKARNVISKMPPLRPHLDSKSVYFAYRCHHLNPEESEHTN